MKSLLLHIIESFGEILYHLISLISRIYNTLFLKGDMYQTASARTYAESFTSEKWKKRKKFINAIFFWQDDHCKSAWLAEVNRAIKTIEKNKAISEATRQMNKQH